MKAHGDFIRTGVESTNDITVRTHGRRYTTRCRISLAFRVCSLGRFWEGLDVDAPPMRVDTSLALERIAVGATPSHCSRCEERQ